MSNRRNKILFKLQLKSLIAVNYAAVSDGFDIKVELTESKLHQTAVIL